MQSMKAVAKKEELVQQTDKWNGSRCLATRSLMPSPSSAHSERAL